MPKLSIILPTCNRAPLLKRALQSIQQHTSTSFELLVVDGASTDHTPQLLQEASQSWGAKLRVIREPEREGFVKAVNKGFREAAGEFVTWINDDARPLPGALDSAVEQFEYAPASVGMVAMFHHFHSEKNIAYQTTLEGRTYSLCHVRGTLYANFGLARRETFARLGYFDERYFLGASDPDFSLKVWQAGMSVVPAYSALIDHDETQDERRTTDSTTVNEDNRKLFEKWALPSKNPWRNDFDPRRPCTLMPGSIAA